jgi:hypothetical protein
MRAAILSLLVACTWGSPEDELEPPRTDAQSVDGLADLRTGMAACMPAVDACLTGVVEAHPDVSGRLAVRVVIRDGVVTTTEVVTDRTGVPAAAACATDVIPTCGFAAGLNDSITLPISVPPVQRLSPLAPPGP